MKVLTITDLRKNIAAVIDDVIYTNEECVVPRNGGTAVVIVSLEEWNSMRETLDILADRKVARQVLDGMDDLDAGQGIERDLIDPDAQTPGAKAA